MKERILHIQGRSLSESNILEIKKLIVDNPGRHRTWLSRELCERWNWRNEAGQVKDMACRNLLLKLERQGYLDLPVRQGAQYARRGIIEPVLHSRSPITEPLSCLTPLRIIPVVGGFEKDLFSYLLHRYHYLGYSGAVGENLKYLIFDRQARPVCCLLFGSAAWSIAPRDRVIGWSREERKRHLGLITNNTRFLILPWVTVFNLASYVLSRVVRRISADWIVRYGHPIYLLETFVETVRFHGSCYKAANWRYVGGSTGRTRNGPNAARTTEKAIYLYPLISQYRRYLCSTHSSSTNPS